MWHKIPPWSPCDDTQLWVAISPPLPPHPLIFMATTIVKHMANAHTGPSHSKLTTFWSRKWVEFEEKCYNAPGLTRYVLIHFLIILGVWGCVWKLNITAFRIGFDLNDWFSFRSARTDGRGGIGSRRRGSLNRFVPDHFPVIFNVWGCVRKLINTTFRTRFDLVDWFGFRRIQSVSSSWCPSHLPPYYHCPPHKFLIISYTAFSVH